MTFANIKEELHKLNPMEQDKLASLLATIRLQRDETFTEELATTLDKTSAESWISLDDLKKDLFK